MPLDVTNLNQVASHGQEGQGKGGKGIERENKVDQLFNLH